MSAQTSSMGFKSGDKGGDLIHLIFNSFIVLLFPATGVVDNDIIYPMSVRDIKKVEEIHRDQDFDIIRDHKETRHESALPASRLKELQMENEIIQLKKQLEDKKKQNTANNHVDESESFVTQKVFTDHIRHKISSEFPEL